jgi:hypothetical protein
VAASSAGSEKPCIAKVCALGAEACFDAGVQAQSATTAKAVARPARRHLSKNWRIWSSLSLKL